MYVSDVQDVTTDFVGLAVNDDDFVGTAGGDVHCHAGLCLCDCADEAQCQYGLAVQFKLFAHDVDLYVIDNKRFEVSKVKVFQQTTYDAEQCTSCEQGTGLADIY